MVFEMMAPSYGTSVDGATEADDPSSTVSDAVDESGEPSETLPVESIPPEDEVPTEAGSFDGSLANRATGDVYISANGNDANSGTQTNPVQTFTKAVQLVSNNGTIYVMNNLTDMGSNINVTSAITVPGTSALHGLDTTIGYAQLTEEADGSISTDQYGMISNLTGKIEPLTHVTHNGKNLHHVAVREADNSLSFHRFNIQVYKYDFYIDPLYLNIGQLSFHLLVQGDQKVLGALQGLGSYAEDLVDGSSDETALAVVLPGDLQGVWGSNIALGAGQSALGCSFKATVAWRSYINDANRKKLLENEFKYRGYLEFADPNGGGADVRYDGPEANKTFLDVLNLYLSSPDQTNPKMS